MSGKVFISIETAAERLGVSSATVRNWIKAGYLTEKDMTGTKITEECVTTLQAGMKDGDLDLLAGRANKSKISRTFSPYEYLDDKNDWSEARAVLDFIKVNAVETSAALFLLSLNLLTSEGLLDRDTSSISIPGRIGRIGRQELKKELASWETAINTFPSQEVITFILDCKLSSQTDILGFFYQSMLAEAAKAQIGSYYTPERIVKGIVKEYVKSDSKVLDPCCGTGQFLLSFSEKVKDPSNIYGIDNDELAVRIARINLIIKYKNRDFSPNIVCKNTLFDLAHFDLNTLDDEPLSSFDIIATNPPWGVHFSFEEVRKLRELYPDIMSAESFSFFLQRCLSLLKPSGILSFILPESILHVQTHKDIRRKILDDYRIGKIIYLGRIFTNVFTPTIRVDIFRDSQNFLTQVIKENCSYNIPQSRWATNHNYIIDIHSKNDEFKLISRIYETPHTTLSNQAIWALGIVTGNNKKFVSNTRESGYEPVYKGRDVEKLVFKNPTNYLEFLPDIFQQVAFVEKYRAKEKLIYKFISKHLVVAYDDKQRLTLNSANILIPSIPNYPIKAIAAFLNSKLYQFIFQKKFNSIKILRGQLEQLPLPLWSTETLVSLEKLADDVIRGDKLFSEIDCFIEEAYAITESEKTLLYG